MSTTQNLTLLTDLYELTMMQGYFKNPVQETVIFDAFYRTNPCGNGFAIAAGLDQVIDYICISPKRMWIICGAWEYLMRTFWSI